MNAEQWNAMYPVGTPVFAYPGCRPEDIPSATRLVTRTRTKAQLSASGDPVVWVEGEGAYICLTHVDPVSESAWNAAKSLDVCGAREPEPRTGTSPCVLPAGHGGLKHQDKWTNQWPALPVPVGDQPQPLDDTRLAEPIPARWDRTVILPEHPNGDLDGQTIVCCIADDGTKRPIGLFLDDEHREALGLLLVDPNGEDEEHATLLAEVQRLKAELASAQEDIAFTERNTLPELRRTAEHHQDGKKRWRDRAEKAEARVAELEAERHTTNEALSDAAETLRANSDRISELEAELAKYVGKEPTIAEEMEYLSGCLNAVRDLCDATEKQATRWEHPLTVPEWVETVRAAADGVRPDDPNDNRHRILVDGKGNGWISVCSDEGSEWVVPIQPAAHVEQDVRDVAADTGSLREIGRCW